ncbi:MAG TPA: hypothetical protein VFS00_22210, partial [Polyangiaceae bacterium]|nr:hypothetical protein [Polyangiaceae bacterium]
MTPAHLDEARLAALRAGAEPDEGEAEHLLDCRACSGALEGDDALARMLNASRGVEPAAWNDARVAAGQARLAGVRRRAATLRYAAPAFAGALAAAAAWALWVRPAPPAGGPWAGAEPTLAEVERQPDAALSLAQSGPDEVVEVARGQASFKVRHL